MKIIIDTDKLASALSNIYRAVPNKSADHTLEGILITAEELNETVTLTGYDLEIGSQITLDAFVTEKARFLLNARNFYDIIRFMPGDKVTIESEDKRIFKIYSGDTQYTITGMDSAEYPELPRVSGDIQVDIAQTLLKDMILKTKYAASMNDSRPVHMGIKFEIDKGELTLVALDGFRLAVRKEVIDYAGDKISFILPPKAFNEIIKYLGDDDGKVTICPGERHIAFLVDGYTVVSNLIEGEFLNYRNTIPASFTTTVTVSTRDLIECVERSSLLVSGEKIKTPVRCLIENGELKFSNVTTQGTAKDRCYAEIDGKSLEIGFNGSYMKDALRAADCDKVRIDMNNSNSPIIISPIEGSSFIHLVLPMRLKTDF